MFSFTNKMRNLKKHTTTTTSDESRSNHSTTSGGGSSRRPRPKLERRNANKNIDYDAITASTSASLPRPLSPSSPDEQLRATRSLDLSPNYSNQTSFRIGGSIEGEVDLICRSLGLSGPEDFAIPAAAWESHRRFSTDLLPKSRLSPKPYSSNNNYPLQDSQAPESNSAVEIRKEVRVSDGAGGIKGVRPPTLATPPTMDSISTRSAPPTVSVKSAMKLNPSPSSVLNPPPSISLPEIEKVGSTWDLVMAFAPEEGQRGGEVATRTRFEDSSSEEEDNKVEVREGVGLGREVSEGEDVTSTSNDDDSSSTTEVMFVISPNGRFKGNIKSWMRGQLLGSGSFGTVYEGISDEGVFFAVKEVSLLDKGSDAQQCIVQLEQEIALLSQFEHENIVRYYGTDKEDAKLFIFLELVTQGSLASLYQKYRLRDGHVSAYTRQILKGLNYLHERNVVHRDIKCANILVHADGSVKLADFGLAKEMTKINMLKSCKGSVYWMAPEVVRPRKTYGPPADIWSLGCTVLEMLTRQIPYPNQEWQHVLFKIGRGDQPPIPSNLSDDARDFITQCVQVNPDDRPTASQLLDHSFLRPLSSVGSGSDYASSPGKDRWS